MCYSAHNGEAVELSLQVSASNVSVSFRVELRRFSVTRHFGSVHSVLNVDLLFRINFALNSGSISLPSEVLIFTPQGLDDELDRATCLALQDSVQVTMDKRSVSLPKVCEWFADDFAQFSARSLTSAPSALRRDSGSGDIFGLSLRGQSIDAVRAVLPYLLPEMQQQLRQLLSDGGSLHVR